MADNESANISKYRGLFKGSVPKTFSKPSPFKLVTVRPGSQIQEFGYGPKVSHPTPTDPWGGRK